MPATTRGSVHKETDLKSSNKTKMSAKKKDLTLAMSSAKLRKAIIIIMRTEESFDDMDVKMDTNHKVLLNYIEANDAVIKSMKDHIGKVATRLTAAETTVTELEDQMSTLTDELEETRKQCKAQKQIIENLQASDREMKEEKKRSNIIIMLDLNYYYRWNTRRPARIFRAHGNPTTDQHRRQPPTQANCDSVPPGNCQASKQTETAPHTG